ncbi:prolyl oligopeptidase family serine peptidase [Micromonospora sp. NPDC023956]|uniref:S9 family peptidase n=1 Tax=Micromonospora sp. NPDC023956 TaxID=3155722 RepID=UPI0033D84498
MTTRHVDVGQRAAAHRLSFRFSGRAGRAACLVADGNSTLVVESWSFQGTTAEAFPLPTTAGETVRTQLLPAEDGRVVLLRHRPGTHEVVVVDRGDGRTGEQPVGRFDCPALRAVPSLDTATLAWLVAFRTEGCSVLHRIDARTLRAEAVVEVAGHLTGGGWLTGQGHLLAANQLAEGQRRLVAVDLRRATVSPIEVAGSAVLLTSPRRGRMLVATATSDGVRLGWAAPDGRPVRYPPALNAITGTVLPLAVDPTGRRLAVRITAGTRSRLLVHDDDADQVTEIPLPPGVVRSAGWSGSGLRLVWSSPTCPTTIVTPHPGGGPDDRTEPDTGTGWHDARPERFDGPAGPVEAVVYGDWRQARHLLVALHGGPEAAWELAFDPFFQSLAAAGVAIVAPNQRGSTNYGAAHRAAIDGAWGGPDLADIRWLRETLNRERRVHAGRAPMLFGTSYGAFLALLAAAADPHGWSRCVVVAPFLSGPQLYRDGSPAVRSLLDRSGGRTSLDDELGPRDLLRLAPRIRARLLIVHGQRDDVIPVGHSRSLARRLRETGRRAPRDFRYREVTGGGHNPLDETGGQALRAEVVDFLTSEQRG